MSKVKPRGRTIRCDGFVDDSLRFRGRRLQARSGEGAVDAMGGSCSRKALIAVAVVVLLLAFVLAATFAGWDFGGVWEISEGSFPTLRGLPPPFADAGTGGPGEGDQEPLESSNASPGDAQMGGAAEAGPEGSEGEGPAGAAEVGGESGEARAPSPCMRRGSRRLTSRLVRTLGLARLRPRGMPGIGSGPHTRRRGFPSAFRRCRGLSSDRSGTCGSRATLRWSPSAAASPPLSSASPMRLCPKRRPA